MSKAPILHKMNTKHELRGLKPYINVALLCIQHRAFCSDNGTEAFKKHLVKKGFVEERGFKKLVSPFKEEVKKRGWETVSQHMEPGRNALVKEFYANLGERKNLSCYAKGRWVPFRERVISQLFRLRVVGD